MTAFLDPTFRPRETFWELRHCFTDYNDSVFFPVICSLPFTVMWIFNLSRIYKTCFTSIIILSFVKQSANKMTLKEYKGHKISTNLDNFIRFEKWAIMLMRIYIVQLKHFLECNRSLPDVFGSYLCSGGGAKMSKEWDRNLKFGRKLERHIILVLHVSVKSPIY